MKKTSSPSSISLFPTHEPCENWRACGGAGRTERSASHAWPRSSVVAGKLLVGTQVESLHQSYGEVLGITKAKEAVPTTANLLEALRVAQRAISAYQLQLAAAAVHDEAFVPAATKALAPVDEARAAAARRARGQAEPEVTPDTPLPELPAA